MPFRDVDANLRHTLCLLASHQAAGEVREAGGMALASAGVRFSMFNAALVSAPVGAAGDLERKIAAAAEHFQARGLEWSCWVCDHWLEAPLRLQAASLFAAHGLQRATIYPGMVAEPLLPPVRRLPRLEIRPVDGRATQLAFSEIGCVCFHLPVDWFREIFEHDSLWRSGFSGWVGYVDGEAVTTAAAVVAAGSIGIYNVATLPHHRRQGYGEAILRHAVQQAQQAAGIERCVLQSSPKGFPLYARMGFRTVTRFVIYVSR
jgi:GNAT superfamily N-acetyltransferase